MPPPEIENESIRPYMRMAAYWLGRGWTPEQIVDWARTSPHYYNVSYMEQAIPEAARSVYFAARIRAADPNTRMSQLWGYYARGAWYAGYGRAPTAAEREWSFQRPNDYIGLMFEVRGRTVSGRAARTYTITANVRWDATLWDVSTYIRSCIASGSCITGSEGSEPLDASTVSVALIGGALIERQSPTLTVH